MTIIDTREIRGFKCEIDVPPTGVFYIKLDGRTVASADTLDKAVAQAGTKLGQRKARVKVPFVTLAGETGEATGLHASSGNVMARIEGRSMQLSYSDNRVFAAETPTEVIDRYLAITQEGRTLDRKRRDIEAQHVIDLRGVVRLAVTEASQAQESDDGA